MQCMCCILFSMSVFILDQNILLSGNIFVEPGFLKCSASTTRLFSSSGPTILSPANSKVNRLVVSLKARENSSGSLSFCLFLTYIFSCSNFGSRYCDRRFVNQTF